MHFRPILAIIAFLFSGAVLADFDRGLAAYRMGDFDQAFEQFRLDAVDGHASAQYNLGVMYYRGEGVKKDVVRAWAWMILATQHRSDAELEQAVDLLAITMSAEDRARGLETAARLARQYDLKYRPFIDSEQTRIAGN